MAGMNVRNVTAAVTAIHGDVILANATTAAFPVTLPAPSWGLDPIVVKKTDVSVNAVTVTRSGTATIDGAITVVLSVQYAAVQLIPDGTNWRILAKHL